MAETKLTSEQMDIQLPAIAVGGYGGAELTIASASFNYISQSNLKAQITVKKGKTVLVFLNISGLSHSNAGYSTIFDVGMDGLVTKSNSGQMGVAMQGINGLGQFCFPFIFTNVPAGVHTFYGLWNSGNVANTSKINLWANCQLTVIELQPTIG